MWKVVKIEGIELYIYSKNLEIGENRDLIASGTGDLGALFGNFVLETVCFYGISDIISCKDICMDVSGSLVA